MFDLPLTVQDASKMLRSGLVTSKELTLACIDITDKHDASLGTFITRFKEESLEAANRADTEIANGINRGPLHGIPMAIKDTIAVSEGPTSAQSLVLDPLWAEDREGPVIKRLKNAGVVLMGKTTTCEFAIGIPDSTKPFPIPRNPWDLTRWPGGSSSGSANGIAAGLFLGGIGSDTGGSIRIPAAFCGITGLMPTFGRVPVTGSVPLSFSLDRIGPLARSAWDCGAILQTIAGYDSSDQNSVNSSVPDYLCTIEEGIKGLRVGIPHLSENIDTDTTTELVFTSAVEILRSLGAHVENIEIPFYKELCSSGSITLASEAMAFHKNNLQVRWLDYAAATREFLLRGLLITGSDYVQAQRVRKLGQSETAELFTKFDVIVMPTVSKEAPLFDEIDLSGLKNLTKFNTMYWNIVGNPAISIPMGFTDTGLPLSIQIASRAFDEATLLRTAHAFQKVTNWHLQRPLIPSHKIDFLNFLPVEGSFEQIKASDEQIVRALILHAGISPKPNEVENLVKIFPHFQSMIKSIYEIPEIHYESMGLKFLAEPQSIANKS